MEVNLFDQAAVAAITVWIIQRLKGWAKLPAIHDGADRLLRVLGGLAALLSAAGILMVTNWNGAEGTFTLVVSGLTASNVALFLWVALKSLISQEVIFRVVKASKRTG